ncbi:MAG: tetratricopeptide repeat protein, partial [Trichodesmium sp. St7_bin2_1]|nr:tetratricopeptide repeat protein [Trichodesmium sp. St7_bin2_1]
MNVSKTVILTLAALSSQNLTAQAKATPNINPYSQTIAPENIKLNKSINIRSLPSTKSITRPETLLSQAHNTPQLISALSTPNLHQIRGILNNSWLGKIVGFSVENNDKFRQIALGTGGELESSLDLNPTLTLLNTLLLVATLLPPVTIGFFWLIRRLVIKELVGEVNKRLTKISKLELSLNKSQNLFTELESHILTAKQSIEFLHQEAKISKSSVEQIEALKSQFLMQLQVIISEAQEAKHQAIQEISQTESIKNTQESKSSERQPAMIADDYLKLGEKEFADGQYNQALATFEKAISLDYASSEAWFKRGNVFVKLQRYADALSSYDRAIAVNPDRFEYWFNRGNVFVRLKRYSEALASYDKALSLQPDNVEIWLNRGILLRKLQRYNEALVSYQQAL